MAKKYNPKYNAKNDEYTKAHYDTILIKFRKDEFMPDLIKKGMEVSLTQSRTEYIKYAIESQLIRDGIDVDKTREFLRKMKSMQEVED